MSETDPVRETRTLPGFTRRADRPPGRQAGGAARWVSSNRPDRSS